MLKDDSIADLFNRINKYVATNSLTDAACENTVLLNQDTIEQVKNLKLTDGIDLQVPGSTNLIQSLLRHDLLIK